MILFTVIMLKKGFSVINPIGQSAIEEQQIKKNIKQNQYQQQQTI